MQQTKAKEGENANLATTQHKLDHVSLTHNQTHEMKNKTKHYISGGTAVHIVGGVAGLVATLVIGPREGRFEGRRFNVIANEFPAFSSTFGTLGTLILWFG